MRRDPKYIATEHLPISEQKLTIIHDPECTSPDQLPFSLWGEFEVAADTSAKVLSDWALRNGAREVRHDYDLRLSENEP
jgi:hypothetical protein